MGISSIRRLAIAIIALLIIATAVWAAAGRNYPEKQGTRWVVGGQLDVVSGGELDIESGGALKLTGTAASAAGDPIVFSQRHRVITAEVNAGHTLVSVPADLKFRLIDVKVIAYGGAITGLTTLDILDGSTKLVAFAQANLAQSAVLGIQSTGATVLADGSSFTARTAGNDITIGKTGGSMATATGVDVIITYALE
ncbi:MAG: hypothetical protein ABFD64_02860 [Armatimonadota bacterium]